MALHLTQQFRRAIKDNPTKCILWVGAGLSAAGVRTGGGGLPDWHALMQRMIEELRECNNCEASQLEILQVALKQGKYLEVAQAYKDRTRPDQFAAFIKHEIDPPDICNSKIHQLILKVNFRGIITTNFDRVFERQSDEITPLVYPQCLDDVDGFRRDNFFAKIHGCVQNTPSLADNLILTEESFLGLRSNPKYQTILRSCIVMHPMLTVGFSLNDPDFLGLISDLRENLGAAMPTIYSLMLEPGAKVRADWLAKGVQILPYDNHSETYSFFQELLELSAKRSAAQQVGMEKSSGIVNAEIKNQKLLPEPEGTASEEKKEQAANSLKQYSAQQGEETSDLDIYDVPQFVDLANRATRKSELNDLIIAHPIVSVTGLSDSGKSYLVASFLNDHSRFKNKGSVIWHEPEPSGSEPLEVLIARLERALKLNGKSLFEKSKQLMRQLEANDQLLVIDDFQLVDPASYSVLIEAASRLKAPARLILISQNNIGMTGDIPDLPPLELSGYDRGEFKHFLIEKQLSHLSDSVVYEFLEKTDGLPIAADWFVFMINRLKRPPEQLLAGKMIVYDRLQIWFNEIEASIGEPASNLLRMLSLCNGPFNLGIVRMLCRQAGNESFEELFETLQRAYLVQSYSAFRWRLHQLIMELCRHKMPDEFKKRTHWSLGIYHRDNSHGIARRFSEHRAFIWQVRACQYFQKSGDYKRWNEEVHRTIKKAKSCGYFRVIIRLLGEEVKMHPSKDPWLTYSYAHCCLRIGQYGQGLDAIKPLIGQEMQDDLRLKIAITRLHASALDGMGKPKVALDTLEKMLASPETKAARGTVVAQVKAVMIHLLIKLKDYGRAEKLAEELFHESVDYFGRAVALANWGIVLECTKRFEMANEKLQEAVNLFHLVKDYPGYGWSLSHNAICQLMLGNANEASLMLRKALKVKSDIDGASKEYLDFLREAQSLFREKSLSDNIEFEIRRVTSRITTP